MGKLLCDPRRIGKTTMRLGFLFYKVVWIEPASQSCCGLGLGLGLRHWKLVLGTHPLSCSDTASCVAFDALSAWTTPPFLHLGSI